MGFNERLERNWISQIEKQITTLKTAAQAQNRGGL